MKKSELTEALDAMKKLSPLLLAGAGECKTLGLFCMPSPVQAACLYFVGYLFTYYNSKVGKEREAQIDRVNEQVKDLYGPLLSCVTASKSAFDAMIRQHSPDGTKAGFVRAIRENPESEEAVAYRYFTLDLVRMPLHPELCMCTWLSLAASQHSALFHALQPPYQHLLSLSVCFVTAHSFFIQPCMAPAGIVLMGPLSISLMPPFCNRPPVSNATFAMADT